MSSAAGLAKKIRTVFSVLTLVLTLAVPTALADTSMVAGFAISRGDLNFLGGDSTSLHGLIEKAQRLLWRDSRFQAGAFSPRKVVSDSVSTTVKYTQRYRGIEVQGDEALITYAADGSLHNLSGSTLEINLDTEAKVTADQALLILKDRYQSEIELGEPAALRVFQDFNGVYRLTYLMKTKTSASHQGREVYLDAHTGDVIVDILRAHDLLQRAVYSAATPDSRQHVDKHGAPTDINFNWYQLVLKNALPRGDQNRAQIDRGVYNAFRNAGMVYSYYWRRFGRLSYDNHDSPIVSVVHAGVHFDNAFWSDESRAIIYGDGDGANFLDMTGAKDVAGHELTHAVTASEANLVYAGESGALNESYSDVFGKMIDFRPGDWDIGAALMGPASREKNVTAIRNMMYPERYGQPGSRRSKLYVPPVPHCDDRNDDCGVHVNSGIPNRAAALITESIGKEKTEQLYYNVLTQRLTANANFRGARMATESACALMFGGQDSPDCTAVSRAFQTVGM